MSCYLLNVQQTAITNASTAVNVYSDQVPPGVHWEVSHLALMNRSGESVTCEFGLTDIVGFRQIYAKQTIADGDAFGVNLDLNVLEGEKLTAVVTGTANKSTVTLIASGKAYLGDPSGGGYTAPAETYPPAAS